VGGCLRCGEGQRRRGGEGWQQHKKKKKRGAKGGSNIKRKRKGGLGFFLCGESFLPNSLFKFTCRWGINDILHLFTHTNDIMHLMMVLMALNCGIQNYVERKTIYQIITSAYT
jgi:hypothetical protein